LVIRVGLATVAVLCVVTAALATANGASPSDSSRPAEAAVFVHEEGPGRLAIADLKTQALRFVVDNGVASYEPVWSPTGGRLSYRIEDQLRLHVDGVAEDRPFIQVPGFKTNEPYAYSPDEKWVAAPVSDAVALVPLPPDPRAPIPASVQRVPLAGCGQPGLLWSTDGKFLLALCTPGGGQPAYIARIAPDTRKSAKQPAGEAGQLLGWRGDGGLLVAGGGGISVLSAEGKLRLLYEVGDNDSVLALLRGPGQALLVQGNEDSGYPTVLRLVGPKPMSSHPWLRGFGRTAGFSFAPDGWWAVFVQLLGGDREGGDVYVVAPGSEQAVKVLAATPERSYSSPVVRPPARR